MEPQNEEILEKGEKLYFSFVEKVLGSDYQRFFLATPTTYKLEFFYLLDKAGAINNLIGEMCSELSKNLVDEDFFSKDGKLFLVSRTYTPVMPEEK